jgi:hypothetical protein
MQTKWLKRCNSCSEWGDSYDYFHDNITESARWAECVLRNRVSPHGIVCSQDTVAALLSALVKDAICHEAVTVMATGAGQREVAAAKTAAAVERGHMMEEATRTIGKMPAVPPAARRGQNNAARAKGSGGTAGVKRKR